MGYGIRARRRGFVTEGIVAVTGTQTKTWVELGVPNGVTKLTAFLVGGGGGAGGGGDRWSHPQGDRTEYENVSGGGGSGYIRIQEIEINALDSVTITIGSGGASGLAYLYDVDSDPKLIQRQTSGSSGGTTSITYNNVTYSASGGNPSPNTGYDQVYTGSNGGSGGSGGGGGEYWYWRDSWEEEDPPKAEYKISGGYGGRDGGAGGNSSFISGYRHGSGKPSGGSGAGVSTKPRGQSNMECAKGGDGNRYNTRSALGYGDGGYGNSSNTGGLGGASGVVFLFWNNGGI